MILSIEQAKELVQKRYSKKVIKEQLISKTGDEFIYFRPDAGSKVNKAFVAIQFEFLALAQESYGDVNGSNAYVKTRDFTAASGSTTGALLVCQNAIFQATDPAINFEGFLFIGYEFDLQ